MNSPDVDATVYPGTMTQHRSVNASACAKAILVGEHAVVYGARAVAMPVPTLQMTVRLTPTTRRHKNGDPIFRVLLGGRSVSPHVDGLVEEAFKLLGIEPFPLDIEGNSTVMIGAGLGSSASLCIVILKALAESVQRPLARYELANFGTQLERRFHGNPSGLDTAVVAMGHVVSFAKGAMPLEVPLQRLPDDLPWRFALLDSGVRSSTMTMIQVATPYFHGSAGERRIANFDQLAAEVIYGLTHGSTIEVAEAMTAAGAYLDEAGVVTDHLSEIIAAAKSVGCLAAKTTGAGGGGCVLALLSAEHGAAQVIALNERLGGTRVCAVELI